MSIDRSSVAQFREGGVSAAENPTYAFVSAFFEELRRSGVSDVCISPGSRSTPLAVGAARTQGLRIWSHLDERAAGFFALGLAKARRKTVGLVCTSGTALANYAPAVIEAHYSGVPLLVLSADRPPELREWGAGQTIDQVKIFGAQIRYFAEMPIPEVGSKMLRYARTVACRAVAESSGADSGPVHLNWPLREPLEPIASPGQTDWADGDAVAEHGRTDGRAYVRHAYAEARIPKVQVDDLAATFRSVEQGVISCGVMDDPDFISAVSQLAQSLGWPILADPASGMRTGAQVEGAPIIAGSDLFLRNAKFCEAHQPTAVLRFGASPVSKALRLHLEAAPPDHFVLVSENRSWQEPSHLATDFILADPASFCVDLCDSVGRSSQNETRSRWLDDFENAEAQTQDILEARIASENRLFEPGATRRLAQLMPDHSMLFVSNSMPIRDLDAFMPTSTKSVRVLVNRGANGIDGIVSTALGTAAASGDPVFLLTGDLAFLYDVGGFLAAKRYALNATIVVLNNDGGGIFSYLPIAAYGESIRFEELFSTPHHVEFKAVADLYDLSHQRVESWTEYSDAILKSAAQPGVSIIEVPVDAEANLKHFRSLVDEVGRAVSTRTTE